MRSRYCYFGLYFPPSESFITTTFYEVILPFSRRLVCCLTSLVGISCAQPFTEDRHDLTHFRIAGAGVFDGVGDAVIWDGGLGHSSSPILRWFVDGSMVAEGFTVDLPAAEAYLLEVENQVGEVRVAHLEPGQWSDFSIVRTQVELGDNYGFDYRSSVYGTTVDSTVSQGYVARLQGDLPSPNRFRWMTANAEGTFLELSANTTDFVDKRITFADGEVVSAEEVDTTFFHLLALAIDETGNNGWQWFNVAFGEGNYLRHYGHLIPASFSSVQRAFTAVTIDDIDKQTGFLFSDVEIVDSVEQQSDFECFNSNEPFLLDWALTGKCGLDELKGKRVVVEVW